jgi:hypothetical protein
MQMTPALPLTHCILDATEPAVGRRQRPSLAQIRAFILDWYQCIDERAPVALLLPLLARNDLELRFPDQTLHSATAFRDWYEKLCSSGATVKHEIIELQIYWDRAAGYGAECSLYQRFTDLTGEVRSQRLKSQWQLRVSALGAIAVTRCVVTRLR